MKPFSFLLAGLALALAGCMDAPVAAEAVAAPAPARVLIFSKTTGWRHDSIPAATAALQQLATQQSMVAEASEEAGLFTPDGLSRYRVVVFANTTGDVLDAAQQQALHAFVDAGGGFMGVHSAADTEYDWPWYGELVGAWFLSHPPDGLRSSVVTFNDGRQWPVTDEFYDYRRNPRPHVEVIATLDESRYQGGRMGEDHPIAWCRRIDGGRTWYTGLGHDAALYATPEFRAHLVRGLRYASGLSNDC